MTKIFKDIVDKVMGHLTIGRRTGEVVCIGDDVEVTVRSVVDSNNRPVEDARVRLAFVAPTFIRIDRKEFRIKRVPMSHFRNAPVIAAKKDR